MIQNIDKMFNRLAKYYDKDFEEENLFNNEYERPNMIKNIGNVKGKYVLDGGCGGGWYIEKLLERGAIVTAIDINENMVEIAKKRVSNNAQILKYDLNKKLPFEDDKFDMIISSLTLHYIKDLKKVFKEFQRVLKKDSTFLFSIHHPFMNYKEFKTEESYFSTHLKNDFWKKGEERIKVQFYHRSLQEIINNTLKFFEIEKIIEPQPTDDFKRKNMKDYKYLNNNPHFLIIKAKNRKIFT